MTSVCPIFVIHEKQQLSLLKVNRKLSHFGVEMTVLLKLRHSRTVLISSLSPTLLLPLLTLLLQPLLLGKKRPIHAVNEI